MDHFISMYIDDELSLDEKIMFVKHVHDNRIYTDEAVSLLEQEKILGAALNLQAPETKLSFSAPARSFHSLGMAMAACLLLVLAFLVGANLNNQYQLDEPMQASASLVPATVQHRFVLLQQDSALVEITGSFTSWQKIPLKPTGSAGYWEVTLQVPVGEHQYSFIVDGTRLLPDPTVASQEPDDFGTINSILNVES